MRKLALKKLKGSDLSFFKSYFKRHPQTKQKAFNLDTALLERQFFPGLKAQLAPRPRHSTLVHLTLLGPSAAPAYTLARKIKIDAKNLRLNGELIHDPDDQPGRFDSLKEDDFALFEFGGSLLPETISVVLVSASAAADAALHAAFLRLLPSKNDSMRSVSVDELKRAIGEAELPLNHPVCDWMEPTLLESVAEGDSIAIEEVIHRRPGRGMSAAELKDAKASAEKVGDLGEELLDTFFSTKRDPLIDWHQWTSQANAISPYDFLAHESSGAIRHVDAKSTSGGFDTRLYLSMAEIRHALGSGVPYDIYRLYEVNENGAKLRVARDIRGRLEGLTEIVGMLPRGVGIDSLSFKPDFFSFEEGEFEIQTSPAVDH